jgi:hypothetical protein
VKELGLDPKQYKYLKSDGNTTTLQHKKGHTVTIAHSVLSPKNQEILKALATTSQPQEKADGGYVKEIHSDESEPGYTDDTYALQLGHEPKKMAGGGPVDTYAMGLPCLNPNCKSHGKPHPNCRCYGMAEGGKVSHNRQNTGDVRNEVHYCAHGKPHMKGCGYYKDGGPVKNDSWLIQDSDILPEIPPAQYPPAMGHSTTSDQDTQRHQEEDQENDQYRQAHPAPQELDEDQGYENFQRQGLAKGGPVPQSMPTSMSGTQPFAKGGNVEAALQEILPWIRKQMQSQGQGRKMYAEGKGPAGDASSGDQSDLGYAGDVINSGLNSIGITSPEAGRQGADVNPDQSPPPQTQEDLSAAQSMPDTSSQQDQIDQNQNQDMTGGMSTGPATPPDITPPPPAASNPNMGPPTPQHPALANPQAFQQAVHDNIMDENRAWSQDLSEGKIEPKTYKDLFDNGKGTLGKIGTLFGLMLSGAGSGLAHQPNMLMEMMNKELDRDLKAQETSSSNRQNYIKMAQQHELNKASILATQAGVRLTDAQADSARQDGKLKARMLAQRSVVADLGTTVDNMPEGQPKQAAMNALGMMYNKVDSSNSDMASQYAAAKAMMHFGGQGYGGPGSEQAFAQGIQSLTAGGQGALAKDMEEHHFSGIPQRTNAPIEGKDKDQVNSFQNVNDLFNRSLLFARQPIPKNPSDLIKYRAAASALHGSLIGSIKQAQHDGVYKPSEADFILGQIGDSPSSVFRAYNVVPKIKELQGEKQNEYNNLLKKYGVGPQQLQGQVPAPQSQQRQAAPQPQGQVSKSGRPIEYRNGKAFYTK